MKTRDCVSLYNLFSTFDGEDFPSLIRFKAAQNGAVLKSIFDSFQKTTENISKKIKERIDKFDSKTEEEKNETLKREFSSKEIQEELFLILETEQEVSLLKFKESEVESFLPKLNQIDLIFLISVNMIETK